jgi:hypothetical protein
MEATLNDPFNPELMQEPERPQFLKVLCILSFIACGLMILVYAIGTICLGLDEDTKAGMWQQLIAANSKMEDLNPDEFFHNLGMTCLYCLVANIFSLVGVIMMWRLEKIGFYIYVVAELSVNFFNLGINMGEETKSYSSLIFSIIVDLAFIAMYFVNLKYMNKKPGTVVAE